MPRNYAASCLFSFLIGPASAAAGSLEAAGYIGPTLPTYEQSFRYDPGGFLVPISGVTLTQTGAFQLDAKGGLAVGAGLTWYFALNTVGIEGRLDTADVDVNATGARFNARVDLPAPLGSLSQEIELGAGTVDLERLRPISLNLKVKTPGPIRLAASGGLSYLPEFTFVITQPLGLGVTGIDPARRRLDLSTIAVRAVAEPNQEGTEGKLGANIGGGIQLSILPKIALALEARYFVFRKRTLRWRAVDTGARSALEQALAQEIERRLDPVEFNPTYFQATAGVTLSF